MTVRTYRPGFKIFITKCIFRREGVSSRQASVQVENNRIWDITDYLGENSTISVRQDLYNPLGSWIVTVPDAPFSPTPGTTATDTLYSLIEPCDGIEIYLARSPETYSWSESNAGNCPVLMRGFVREITRSESMGPDGKPRRMVVIQGQNYGAIFEMLRVWLLTTGIIGIPDEFARFFLYGPEFTSMPTRDFFQLFVDMGNKFIDGVWKQGGWNWEIIYNCTVTEGVHVMMGLDGQEGPLWSVIKREQDAPWNEIFFSEEQRGPVLNYRPAPWKSYQVQGKQLIGTYLPQGNQVIEAETVEIDVEDIVNLEPSRSDDQVSNLFWLNAPTAIQGGYMEQIIMAAISKHDDLVEDKNHPNNDPNLYGTRKLSWAFRQWPNDTMEHPVTASEPAHRHNSVSFDDWWAARLKWLRDANRDNVVFEEGRMTIKGNEKIAIGKYLHVTRGMFDWECYITGVTHTFAPFRAYTTTINFIRGTGFWKRTLSEIPPYLLEGKRGVYDT